MKKQQKHISSLGPIVFENGQLNAQRLKAEIQTSFNEGLEAAKKQRSNVIEMKIHTDPYIEYGTRRK